MPVSPALHAPNPASIAEQRPLEGRGLRVALGGHEILHGIDVHVDAGETVALLGGNGSGKTTLIRTLLGLIPAAGGERLVFGTPLAHFKQWRRVGYVPQRGQLQVANATVREIVESGRLAHRRPFLRAGSSDKAAIARAIGQVNLGHRVKDQFVHLSGGQQQRTLIARALASGPELLVLDEPLAGLDLPTQHALSAVLGDLKSAGLALLVVLHELGPLAGLIDRSVVLQDGRVIYDGRLEDGPGTPDQHHHEHTGHPRLFDPARLSIDPER